MRRIHRLILASVVTATFALVGCGGSAPAECEPLTECSASDCGTIPDGCGGTLECDACPCEPLTECPANACGTISDGCEGSLECGGCDTGETCTGNVCVADCTPESDADLCSAASAECGSITATDACGDTRTVACGGCGTGYTCENNACVASTCEPETCASLGHQCGTWDDGCGGTVDCQDCAGQYDECQGGQCVCVARTCEDLGRDCGEWNDGCGGRVTCGPCGDGEICRFDGLCIAQCVPMTCADAGAECGIIQDGCGGTVNCDDEAGGCTGGDVCGGGGPNLCGSDACEPLTCDDLLTSDGIECGQHSDGCGDLVTCGPCAASERCDSAYACVPRCVPTTCEAEEAECGVIDDGCGGTINCDVMVGGCEGDDVCGGGGPNKCGEDACTPSTCADLDYECGTVSDGCGELLDCDADVGGCGTGEICDAGTCVAGGDPDGSACEDDADCANGVCVTEADYGWRLGYCTGICFDDGDCTEGAHCAYIDPGTGEGFCMATCETDGDCREEGYICLDGDGQGLGECIPGASGDGDVGDACDGYWECGGREYGFCADLWPDGYCMIDCTLTDCPDGSTCLNFGDDEAYCTADCDSHADCRAGYFCADLDDFVHGVCIPGCVDDGECEEGEVCFENVCVSEEGGAGEPCTTDVECPTGECFTEDDTGWYEGYCTGDCTTDAACGLDGHCSFRGDGGEGLCLLACDDDEGCRAGYVCVDDDQDRGVCVPGADGDGAVGDGCDGYWDCGGRDRGFCIDEWPDGYCSETCGDDFTCPEGAECVGAPDGEGGTFWFCVAECANDAECRGEYACTDVGVDVCLPEDDGAAATGSACVEDEDCFGEGALCISEAEDGWEGGYCSQGCFADGDCAGGQCVLDDGDGGLCAAACDGDDDCREGYACVDIDETDRGSCWPFADGTGEAGAPCTTHRDCTGGVLGFCITEASGFDGGYCTAYCSDDTHCEGDGVCAGGLCSQPCETAAECRDGYICDAFDTCWVE